MTHNDLQRLLRKNPGVKIEGEVPDSKPKRHKAKPLGKAAKGEKEMLGSVLVRFIGRRVRPLDPDNFAGSCKDSLDFLRHAGIIDGDEPWRIQFETTQEKVSSFDQEETIIEVYTLNTSPADLSKEP